MKNRFSIGEISKLYNIPVKTLRYYDEIGLFKANYVDENTRYRYYSTEQFEQLNMINYLKVLGIPLKEIKNHLETRSIDDFLELLKEQKRITENKINELKKIKKRFENRIEEIEDSKKINKLETVIIKTIKERKIIRLKERISSEPELEICLKKLEKKASIYFSIIIGKVGLTVSMNSINKTKFDEYNSIFLLIEEDGIDNDLLETIEEGEYACIYYRGNHSKSPKYYKIIIDYLNKNNYEIIGDSIERTIINEFISKDKKDYLTEIQIKVKRC